MSLISSSIAREDRPKSVSGYSEREATSPLFVNLDLKVVALVPLRLDKLGVLRSSVEETLAIDPISLSSRRAPH